MIFEEPSKFPFPRRVAVMKSQAGYTLLELLIVLGIMGIFMGLGISRLRPPAAYLFTNDLKATIQQARFEAIKRNTLVAVVWNSSTKAFTTRLDTCTGTTINTKRISDYPNISISTNMTGNGIIWMPNGLARSCTTGVGNSTTSISDGRKTYNLVTSTNGRVRITKP